MDTCRPAIVAMDVITALGTGMAENWSKMLAGETGIQPLKRISSNRPDIRTAGEIGEDILAAALENEAASFERLAFDLAVRVGRTALDLAGIKNRTIADGRLALILSTTKGEMNAFQELFRHCQAGFGFNPFQLASEVAEALCIQGPVWAVSNACASGLVAIVQGAWLIQWGQADRVLVIGVDTLTEFVLEGFSVLRAMSPRPSRPFDQSRDGLSLGEGAAALVLARPDQAGDHAEAYLSGWGISNDANHITGPSRTGSGLQLALAQALQKADLKPADIDCLNAHGTATVFNDEMEAQAYDAVFGPDGPPISAFKGFFGHTLGAAGVIEAALSMMTFRDHQVPATKGFETLGVSKPLKIISEPSILNRVNHIITAKAGFGGVNAALILTRDRS